MRPPARSSPRRWDWARAATSNPLHRVIRFTLAKWPPAVRRCARLCLQSLCSQLGLVGTKKGCMTGQVVGPVTGEPAATFLAQGAPQLGHEPAPCVRAFVRDLCWPHGQEALQIAHPADGRRRALALGAVRPPAVARGPDRVSCGGTEAGCRRHDVSDRGCLGRQHRIARRARGLLSSPIHSVGAGLGVKHTTNALPSG